MNESKEKKRSGFCAKHGYFRVMILIIAGFILLIAGIVLVIGRYAYWLASYDFGIFTDLVCSTYASMIGTAILVIGIPHFLKTIFTELAMIRYWEVCESGDDMLVNARIETAMKTFFRMREWIFVVPNKNIRAFSQQDRFKTDRTTAVFIIDEHLLMRQSGYKKYVVKTTILLRFLKYIWHNTETVRFVTCVGYAEFPIEKVMINLQKHAKNI